LQLPENWLGCVAAKWRRGSASSACKTLQDAARKRREPSRHPGAWAGATVMTDSKAVCMGVTKERWTKLQAKIRWIGKQLDLSDTFSKEADQEMGENTIESGGSGIHFKSLECNVGFIIYVAMGQFPLVLCAKI
jgi:hypothetical protein